MPEPAPASPANGLPQAIVQALALANANAVGEQPAILANLALANQVFTVNLQQQNAVALQQALNQLTLVVMARCSGLILSAGRGADSDVRSTVDGLLQVLDRLQRVGAPVAPAPSKP